MDEPVEVGAIEIADRAGMGAKHAAGVGPGQAPQLVESRHQTSPTIRLARRSSDRIRTAQHRANGDFLRPNA